MTQQNNEFEKWATKHIVSKRLLEFNTMKYENGMYKSHIMQRKFEAWQAAKADSESILQEQQNTIAEIELDYNRLLSDFLELQAQNSELSASINVLREALMDIAKTNASTHGTTQMMLAHCIKSANEALTSTPAQSLQAHDNEVIERCAKHIEKVTLVDAWAEAIRALKGTS